MAAGARTGKVLPCSRPPSLPRGWGRCWGWHLAMGLGTALVDTLGHCWSLLVATESLWQGLRGGGGCDSPVVLPHISHHPEVSAGLARPRAGGDTRTGPHSCCGGTGTGTHTAGGSHEGVGTARCWHTAGPLLQELGHWDRARAARVTGHSCPLLRGASTTTRDPQPRAKCHHPAGDTTSVPTPARAALSQHPARPAGPGGQPPPCPLPLSHLEAIKIIERFKYSALGLNIHQRSYSDC